MRGSMNVARLWSWSATRARDGTRGGASDGLPARLAARSRRLLRERPETRAAITRPGGACTRSSTGTRSATPRPPTRRRARSGPRRRPRSRATRTCSTRCSTNRRTRPTPRGRVEGDCAAVGRSIRRDAPDNIILIGAPSGRRRWGRGRRPFVGDNLATSGTSIPASPLRLGPGGAFTQVAAARPMMITEWGYRRPPSRRSRRPGGFGEPLKAYIEAQRLGWTAWCADTIWDSIMFDPDWNLRSARRDGRLHEGLARREEGRRPPDGRLRRRRRSRWCR